MVDWGTVREKTIRLVTLKSESLQVDVSSYGATLVAVRVLAKDEWVDVLLGYESLDQYTKGGKPNFSSLVGRCANRIAGGRFELDGETHQLDRNNGDNHLHGGIEGYWQRPFDVDAKALSDTSVTLELSDPAGSMGYPGNVELRVVYEVVGAELHFRYEGKTDAPTLLNLTNHGYWNLKGHSGGDVRDHSLMVAGSQRTAVDDQLIITGELLNVKDTPFDLRETPKRLEDTIRDAGPIDTNYCLDKVGPGTLAATLVGPNGISMDVFTDQPGLQVYTGNMIGHKDHPDTWWRGKKTEWRQFGAISLEPQKWPDGIHHSHFPSMVLRPGETYRHHSYHRFRVE